MTDMKGQLYYTDDNKNIFKIVVAYDEYAEEPRRNWDDGTLGYFYTRSRNGIGYKNELEKYDDKTISLLNENDVDLSSGREIYDYLKNNSDYVCLPVYQYTHGGSSISTSSFADPWDSGQVGFIYARKDEVLKDTSYTEDNWREGAKKILKDEVEIYNMYLNNEVYSVGYCKVNKDYDNNFGKLELIEDDISWECSGIYTKEYGNNLIKECSEHISNITLETKFFNNEKELLKELNIPEYNQAKISVIIPENCKNNKELKTYLHDSHFDKPAFSEDFKRFASDASKIKLNKFYSIESAGFISSEEKYSNLSNTFEVTVKASESDMLVITEKVQDYFDSKDLKSTVKINDVEQSNIKEFNLLNFVSKEMNNTLLTLGKEINRDNIGSAFKHSVTKLPQEKFMQIINIMQKNKCINAASSDKFLKELYDGKINELVPKNSLAKEKSRVKTKSQNHEESISM